MALLFFGEGDGLDATGDGAVFPHESFLGMDPISTTTTRLSFKARNGTAVDDDVLVTHATTANGGGYKKVVGAICAAANGYPHSGGFIVVADSEVTAAGSANTNKEAIYSDLFRGMGVTTVAIT